MAEPYRGNQQDAALSLEHITNALSATLDPRIPNHVRQQALEQLEAYKSQPDAPQHGFALAEDGSQNDAVRYYGLQLLEFAVRYRWNEYNPDQTSQLRSWVLRLADGLRDRDAVFIRNKIGHVWVEVAKRSWGDEWMDMDQQLLNLWDSTAEQQGLANRLLVLYILETLTEEVIRGEDAVAGLRFETLGTALNDILVSSRALQSKSTRPEVRAGDEGWMARMCSFVSLCVKQARLGGSPEHVRNMQTCAIKAVDALRPTMSWVNLQVFDEINCVDCLFLSFYTPNLALQTAATEVLCSLLERPSLPPQYLGVWKKLARQAMQPDRIALIRRAFEQTNASIGDDDEMYTLQKKMSELLAVLGDALAMHPDMADSTVDLTMFLELLLLVLQSESLTVSIPVLHSWTKLIVVEQTNIVDLVLGAFGALLQTCSERLLRYEALPEEVRHPIVSLLHEDFETIPERHAFIGNYRRYCVMAITQIARSRPLEALSYALDRMRETLQDGPYTADRGFDSSTYTKSALPVLRFDAQYSVVSSTLKGYSAWTGDVAALTPDDVLHARAEKDLHETSKALEQWCQSMVDVRIDDPAVAEQVLETLVLVLKTLKTPTSSLVLHLVQHLLSMQLRDTPAHVTYSDAVKLFEHLRAIELQKLALAFPEHLLDIFHELELRVAALVQRQSEDARLEWGYKAFLFMIVHRAKNIDPDARVNRLQEMLKPVYMAWTDPSLASSIDSFQGFCGVLGLGDVSEFYRQHGFDRIQDWSAQQLDAAGQAKQTEIKEKGERLPLRMTKSMLAATTERLSRGSDEYDTACALWAGLIPVILPNLLRLLQQAQAYHDPSQWAQLPEELQLVVKRTLQDRFWQSGISNESKDEFYARISGSRTSYEGFASSVRGTIRMVREQGFHLVYLLTKFEEQFYGLTELAGPLTEALFGGAHNLGANHLHPIINLATGLVSRCPPHHRAQFLPPVLMTMFATLDAKISAEWDAIDVAAEQNRHQDDELGDEMRTESVLRQLTYSMVSFVPFLLEFDNGNRRADGNGAPVAQPTLPDLVLSNPSVLEPMMLFCLHALRMRDTRSCSTICRVFKNMVPLFAHSRPVPGSTISVEVAGQVREFIGTEVLKACITSLHEPYFAELQRDLAALIAHIILLYSPTTHTPRDVLLSLPEMPAAKVDRAIHRIQHQKSERTQRGLVLDLLEGVRGVSIYEAGRIPKDAPKKKPAVASQYMDFEPERPAGTVNGEEDGLDGVAGLFGQA